MWLTAILKEWTWTAEHHDVIEVKFKFKYKNYVEKFPHGRQLLKWIKLKDLGISERDV